MDSAATLDLFRAAGALLEGHFKLSSGLHSAGYLQCALVLQEPARAEKLGAALGAMGVIIMGMIIMGMIRVWHV